MLNFIKHNGRHNLLCNIMITLLCSMNLFTETLNTVNNHLDNPKDYLGNDLEVLSEYAKKGKISVTQLSATSSYGTTKNYISATKIYNKLLGSNIVDYAKKFMGLRYVRAGRSLSTGTDCSGFTMLIYREFGINLPSTPSGQANQGSYIAKSDLQKGDLVFYGQTSGKISHVAMYIGNGQVIHESTPKDGVKISPVNMMVYITARRVMTQDAIDKYNSQFVKETETKSKEETQSVLEVIVGDSTAPVTTDNTTSTKEEDIKVEKIDNSENNNEVEVKQEEITQQEDISTSITQ